MTFCSVRLSVALVWMTVLARVAEQIGPRAEGGMAELDRVGRVIPADRRAAGGRREDEALRRAGRGQCRGAEDHECVAAAGDLRAGVRLQFDLTRRHRDLRVCSADVDDVAWTGRGVEAVILAEAELVRAALHGDSRGIP